MNGATSRATTHYEKKVPDTFFVPLDHEQHSLTLKLTCAYHDELFAALARLKFRRQFRLAAAELQYLRVKGLPTIVEHAREFIKTPTRPG